MGGIMGMEDIIDRLKKLTYTIINLKYEEYKSILNNFNLKIVNYINMPIVNFTLLEDKDIEYYLCDIIDKYLIQNKERNLNESIYNNERELGIPNIVFEKPVLWDEF